MRKTKLLFGLAVCSAAFTSQIQASEPWEWSDANYDYPYDECCCEGKLLFLSEFLWWTPGDYTPFANNAFLNTGLTTTVPTAPFGSEVDTDLLPYTRISEKWSPGIRLGLGWETCEGWQLWGAWTGYSNYARRVLNATPPPPPLVPAFGAGVNEGVIVAPPVGDAFGPSLSGGALDLDALGKAGAVGTNATATYKLNYNVADLVFGKSFRVWDCLELMPFAGVRASFIHQRDALKLQGLGEERSRFVIGEGLNSKAYQDLWAVGPRLGFGAIFGDWCGFNLLGNISGAILYGRMEQGLSLSNYGAGRLGTEGPSVTLTTVTRTQDRYNLIVPNVQVQLGFGYDFEFCLGQTPLNVNWFALWEGNTYWGASSRLLFERQFSLNGLTTGFGISF